MSRHFGSIDILGEFFPLAALPAKLVDHSVRGKLNEMERDFEREGLRFEVRGLDTSEPFADNDRVASECGLVTVGHAVDDECEEFHDASQPRL